MIKIAIIDTGCETTAIKNNELIAFYNVGQNFIEKCEPFDDNGHGTACVDIIDRSSSNVEIYVYKIFNEQLVTSSNKLINALKHCIKMNYNIINISLGYINNKRIDEIENLCKELYNNNTLIICAGNSSGKKVYPADFKFTIKVLGHNNHIEEIYSSNEQFTLVAYSGLQRVLWKNGTQNIVSGTSFACARVTKLIAEHYSSPINYKNIISSLNICEIKEEMFQDKTYKEYSKNVMVFPFNKEMHSIVKYEKILPFNIIKIVDLPFSGNSGKMPKDILPDCCNSLIIGGNFSDSLDDSVDTILIGDLSEISRMYNKDQLTKYAILSFKKGKNVISIEFLERNIYETIKEEAQKYNCNFYCLNDYIDKDTSIFSPNVDYSVPIITILGTSSKVGKFTLQLEISELLKKLDYSVSIVSTEPHAFLFDIKTLPLGNYNLLKVIPLHRQINYLRNIIMQENDNNPDLIITSGQSCVVPYSKGINVDYISLSSIITILASKPDAVILCINYNDSINYIRRTTEFINNFGYGKVIMYAISGNSNKVERKGNLVYKKIQHYSISELNNRIRHLESELQIPVVNIFNKEDYTKCIKTIQNNFKG